VKIEERMCPSESTRKRRKILIFLGFDPVTPSEGQFVQKAKSTYELLVRPPVKAPVNGFCGIVPEECGKSFGRVTEKFLRVEDASETLDFTEGRCLEA